MATRRVRGVVAVMVLVLARHVEPVVSGVTTAAVVAVAGTAGGGAGAAGRAGGATGGGGTGGTGTTGAGRLAGIPGIVLLLVLTSRGNGCTTRMPARIPVGRVDHRPRPRSCPS